MMLPMPVPVMPAGDVKILERFEDSRVRNPARAAPA